MSEQDWKPGDVAMVTFANSTTEHRAMRDADGRGWGVVSHVGSLQVDTARRLVVIDPEDREQVERLAAAYATTESARSGDEYRAWDNRSVPARGRIVDTMRAALRSLANPTPRIEEPTGWGAVIEDDTGAYWTLYAPEARVWINYREGKRRWHEITPVRVLSEGVR